MESVLEASAVPDDRRGEYHFFALGGKELAARTVDIGNADIRTSQIKQAIEDALGPGAARVTRLPHSIQDIRQRMMTRKKRIAARIAGKKIRAIDLATQLERIERMLERALGEARPVANDNI